MHGGQSWVFKFRFSPAVPFIVFYFRTRLQNPRNSSPSWNPNCSGAQWNPHMHWNSGRHNSNTFIISYWSIYQLSGVAVVDVVLQCSELQLPQSTANVCLLKLQSTPCLIQLLDGCHKNLRKVHLLADLNYGRCAAHVSRHWSWKEAATQSTLHINHICELQIKNRNESDIRSCKATKKAYFHFYTANVSYSFMNKAFMSIIKTFTPHNLFVIQSYLSRICQIWYWELMDSSGDLETLDFGNSCW